MLIVVRAQDANQLALDEASIVVLSPDAPVQLLYIADETQTITLAAQAISENTDAVLWIVDSDNHLLAYNDNFGDDPNPRIENLHLSAGLYTVYVDSFNGVSEGSVELLITSENRFHEQLNSNENTLTISVTLPRNSVYHYTFELSAENIITITAKDTSSTLDPYLRLLDSAGNELASNDDHLNFDILLDVFDAQIANWPVPEDGLYTLELHDFLGREGTFEIIIEPITTNQF
jgi:hypothetical protein